jgi:hypothetical protein
LDCGRTGDKKHLELRRDGFSSIPIPIIFFLKKKEKLNERRKKVITSPAEEWRERGEGILRPQPHSPTPSYYETHHNGMESSSSCCHEWAQVCIVCPLSSVATSILL